jgi:hypothetical protein
VFSIIVVALFVALSSLAEGKRDGGVPPLFGAPTARLKEPR